MSLTEQLKTKTVSQSRKYPSIVNKYFEKEILRVSDERQKGKAYDVGDQLPAATFLDKNKKVVTLAEERNNKPAILVFYRGSWCPYCNLELRYYNNLIEQSNLKNVNMFAITPEYPDSSMNTENLHFSVFCDLNNQFAGKLNLVFKPSKLLMFLYRLGGVNLKKSQKNKVGELPIPATYVVDEQGMITYAFIDPDYKKRAEPSLVLDEYLKLLHK